uniref:Putative secreted protein n=1 Tax=Ixodes ricinus TaxID=34613 RepID=A0A6B0UCD2_IXORI
MTLRMTQLPWWMFLLPQTSPSIPSLAALMDRSTRSCTSRSFTLQGVCRELLGGKSSWTSQSWAPSWQSSEPAGTLQQLEPDLQTIHLIMCMHKSEPLGDFG